MESAPEINQSEIIDDAEIINEFPEHVQEHMDARDMEAREASETTPADTESPPTIDAEVLSEEPFEPPSALVQAGGDDIVNAEVVNENRTQPPQDYSFVVNEKPQDIFVEKSPSERNLNQGSQRKSPKTNKADIVRAENERQILELKQKQIDQMTQIQDEIIKAENNYKLDIKLAESEYDTTVSRLTLAVKNEIEQRGDLAKSVVDDFQNNLGNGHSNQEEAFLNIIFGSKQNIRTNEEIYKDLDDKIAIARKKLEDKKKALKESFKQNINILNLQLEHWRGLVEPSTT
jgi:hypothetical protein